MQQPTAQTGRMKRTGRTGRMRRTGSMIIAALLSTTAWLPLAQAAPPQVGSIEDDIVILCTNDVHCSIDHEVDEEGNVTHLGYAGVAAYKEEMEQQYSPEQVTLVDAGDAIQGNAIGTLSNGSYLVDLMNQVGYDFAVPGNHEFDYGMDVFQERKEQAKYSYLSANFQDKNGDTVCKPYEIVDYGKTQIAYLGICTPETLTKSAPIHFQDDKGNYIYNFCEAEGKLYEAVQKAVDEARNEGADYVVAIAHLGQEGSSQAWRSDTVLANTTGIDVLLDGHSHEQYMKSVPNKEGKDVTLIQTGYQLAALGKVVIDPGAGYITGQLVKGYDKTDEAIAQAVQDVHDELADVLQQEVAQSDVSLVALDAATQEWLVRRQETNLGDFCADAYRVMLNADIGIINGGGIRTDIAAGTVTYEDVINVHPYGNQLCVVEVTGQQVLDILEMSARLYPESNGGFLQVSGLTYDLDPSIPSPVVLGEKQEFIRVDGTRRVSHVMVNEQPLDVAKTYRLATHDYMIKQGGDGYTMFQDCNIVEDEVMLDNEALIHYIQEKLNGVIGADYREVGGQGRIHIAQSAQQPATSTAPAETPEQQPAAPATPAEPPAQQPAIPDASAEPPAQQPAAPATPAEPPEQQPAAPATPAEPPAQQPATPATPVEPPEQQPAAPVAPAEPPTQQPAAPTVPAAPVAPAAPTTTESVSEEQPTTVIYIVRPGDNLWRIAVRHLGSGLRWKDIYKLNRDKIKNPALIYIGQQLILPVK